MLENFVAATGEMKNDGTYANTSSPESASNEWNMPSLAPTYTRGLVASSTNNGREWMMSPITCPRDRYAAVPFGVSLVRSPRRKLTMLGPVVNALLLLSSLACCVVSIEAQ